MPGVLEKRKRSIPAKTEGGEHLGAPRNPTSKRARSVPDASDNPSESPERSHHIEDVHQPGSLVRVKLTNFVTYTAAEFHLGPSLNMIIGPNGTGKSTLVCAICLGLGWGPQYLGRAKEIGEFVKHGSTEAEIEIELAASGSQRNPVIRRRIQKEGNKTMFYINDVYKSQKDVKALAESFSIQINNLCQFLPQDRVVEFAKMDPITMLGETLRAASSSQMVEWYDELKMLRADERAVERERQNELHHLKTLQAKQSSTREDVDRYHQRQGLVTRLKALETCRPFIRYEEIKAERERIREDIRYAQSELSRYENEVEPVRQAEAEMEDHRAQIERVSRSRKHLFEVKKGAVERYAMKIDTDQQRLSQLTAEIDAETQAERQRKQDVRRLENEIVNLRHQFEDTTVEYDLASFHKRNADIRTRKSAAERAQSVLVHDLKRIRDDTVRVISALRSKNQEKAHLNSRSGQRDSILSNLSPDTHKGWTWLKANMDTLGLNDKVYGPPVIECSVPDPKYADAFETLLRIGDLTAITCTNREDAQKVQNKLVGKPNDGGLGLHQITIRTVPLARSAYTSPLTPDELNGYGFEGWISDYIVGPDAVLAMLCDSVKMHATAFSARRMTTDEYNALERNEKLQRWVAGSQLYSVTRRREYGISSTGVNPVRQAKHFSGQPVATMEMTQVENAIKDLEIEATTMKELHASKKAEYDEAKRRAEVAESERIKVQAEQDHVKKAHAAWEALPRKIAAREVDLAETKKLSDETHNRTKAIRLRCEDSGMAVARDVLTYAKEVTQLRNLHESFLEAEIRLIESTSEVDSFRDDNRDITEAIERQRQALTTLESRKDEKAAEARQLNTRRLFEGASEEVRALVVEHKDLSMEELDNEIAAINSRLELMADGNPRAIKAFEDREKEIQKVEQTLADVAEKLEHASTRIAEIRRQWEPELETIVAAISDGFAHNFRQIGCAGQVSVKKDDDFDKWAVQIEVSFRENEPLAVLNSHRQSGGERAVSTIFYLMALQGLARSPFRVVDEINQGMDPRNERMVHERMVDIACQERTSQYFLVTPKLLNDLKFHSKMKVHCIASGEFMPASNTNLDFRSLAKLAMRVRKGVATS